MFSLHYRYWFDDDKDATGAVASELQLQYFLVLEEFNLGWILKAYAHQTVAFKRV